MRILLLSLFCLFSCFARSQRHDNIWLLGYAGGNQSPANDHFGLSILRFDANDLNIENNQISNLNFDSSNSSMSDSSGNLLFYSNGERVYNAQHKLITNGDGLNITDKYGLGQPQGLLSLPFPNNPDKYALLVSEIKYFSSEVLYGGFKVYFNLLNMSDNIGEVFEKKTIIIEDTLEYGQLSAVKHGNGRDWWVLVPESYTNRYYTMLLNSTGVSIIDTQAVGISFFDGLGQSAFSPDGTKYVRAFGITTIEPRYLHIYDFDRCTGKLSNPVYSTFENTGLGNGCAFSADSRFLYITGRTKIWQYDLHASDVLSTQTLVAEWDGYVRNNQFSTTFSLAQLGPDGRIYISTPNSNPYLHTIEFPDRYGAACQVRQRSITLPNLNSYSIPNHPNFRLGPLDGSPCDTLGLDNLPLASFRWDFEDTISPLRVTFTDLSAYEPNHWHWDFGDGTGSADTSPVHTFPANGLYTVCLTVSNANGADTICHPIQIGTVQTAAPGTSGDLDLRVYPNPFGRSLSLSVPAQPWERVDALLFDALGRPVARHAWRGDFAEWHLEHLPPGVYICEVQSETGNRGAARVIKQ